MSSREAVFCWFENLLVAVGLVGGGVEAVDDEDEGGEEVEDWVLLGVIWEAWDFGLDERRFQLGVHVHTLANWRIYVPILLWQNAVCRIIFSPA